jgi:hypothetical protein
MQMQERMQAWMHDHGNSHAAGHVRKSMSRVLTRWFLGPRMWSGPQGFRVAWLPSMVRTSVVLHP